MEERYSYTTDEKIQGLDLYGLPCRIPTPTSEQANKRNAIILANIGPNQGIVMSSLMNGLIQVCNYLKNGYMKIFQEPTTYVVQNVDILVDIN